MEEWLRSIGLLDRLTAFREQGITPDQLRDLTEENLRELGLTIGERKRFQRALASGGPDPESAAAAGTQAERRPLTVMFVDLVNSTSLGERLDPEDLIEVIRHYRELCGTAISRFGGHIARFLGDGILAYFCYPVANENDPERAVRAALEIVHGIAGVSDGTGGSLQVRIGLATGRVVIGDLFAGGEADKQTILGSCPNLAARLQSLAGPNEIVIAEQTYSRVNTHFVCEPLGQIELRGFDEPQGVWRVLEDVRYGTQPEASRPAPSHGSFYGRDAELDLLRVLWRKAERGDGAAALIVGEAGIGKSRLIDHFRDKHLPPDARVLHFAASAFDQDSPLRPFVDYIYNRAGLNSADSPVDGLAKLEKVLVGGEAEKKTASSVLAGLFQLPVRDPAVGNLTPQQLRQRTISILVEQLLGLARDEPLCISVDDVHWLDPTSGELVQILLDQVGRHRALLILSGRDDAAPNWTGRVHTTIRLGRLSAREVADMMRGLFGNEFMERLVHQVVRRTDGVPLFVEEVGRVLLQHPVEADDSALYEPEEAVPSSLDEILAARLDRAGPARELAQAAAVVGRSVDRSILGAVYGLGESKLDEALTVLVKAGILERSFDTQRETFCFRHALLRDAAYSSLLRERRRELHLRVARILAVLNHDDVDLHPEVLAHHLTEAGQPDKAAPHWLEAARRSLARSALTEAIRMLRRGLDALEKLAEGETTLRARIQLSALLGPALIGLKGPNAPETKELYTAAYELCRRLPEEAAHFPIYWGWWRLAPASLERAGALLRRAVERDDPELLLQAHHCNWATHFHLGSFKECHAHMNAGLSIYEHGDYTHHARLYGNHDAKVCAHGNLCQLFWMEGRLTTAMRAEAQSLAWANRIDHLGSRVHAMGLTLLHRVYRRDLKEVFERSGELISFTREHGLADHGAAGLIFQGWVRAIEGETAAGLAMLEEGFARQREVCTNEDFPVYLCLLAEVLTKQGKPEVAVARILDELPDFEACQLRIWIPELLRVLGEAMLAADSGAVEEARRRFEQARILAESQDVPMLQLRIARSEARLLQRFGSADRAVTRLDAALARIAEDDGSCDIVEARELWQHLAK
jgi:class 3 adenylate cyclase/predicted ATPase